MVGSKTVAEIGPNAPPGSQYIYATVELAALEPDYVALGRVRPNDGPLLEAIDRFLAEHIRELAKKINEQRRHDMDEQVLDEIQQQNQLLDNFKNKFLPETTTSGSSGPNPGHDEGTGKGPIDPPPPPPPREAGDTPSSIEISWRADQTMKMGVGVALHMSPMLRPRVVDALGRTVPGQQLEWCTDDRHCAEFRTGDHLHGIGKGSTFVYARLSESTIESVRIPLELWQVDHVLLTPRSLEIPLGKRKRIVAEVTDDEGRRSTDVLLNWTHDADDPLIVRLNPRGFITGNRVGTSSVTAGAGDPRTGGIWARIRAEVSVVPNPQEDQRGSGFPRLLLTGRDLDPETGEIREGDPEQPALWQEVSDYRHNVWWLNLDNPTALYHFRRNHDCPEVWRAFHAAKTVQMVQQVHMREEYTERGQDERADQWAGHKAALERIEVELSQSMWEQLSAYAQHGEGLE